MPITMASTSIGDPDPEPDRIRNRIRICRIRMFLGLPGPDPLVRGADPGIWIQIRTKISRVPNTGFNLTNNFVNTFTKTKITSFSNQYCNNVNNHGFNFTNNFVNTFAKTKLTSLKGLSHEIDFKNFDKNLQTLA